MKVALRIRSDVETFPGGDYIHLLKTRQTLERMGGECVVLPGLAPLPTAIDAVHLFNLTRVHETALQFAEARRRGLPVVLTPIWHSVREMKRFYARRYRIPGFPIWSYLALKELYYARRSGQRPHWPALAFRRLQRRLVAEAEMVIVSSQAELRTMEEELGVQPRAAVVAPPPFPAEPAPAESAPEVRRDFVCAGRIEPRKNQLAIIRAFKSLGRSAHRLLLFGAAGKAHSAYARAVQQELETGWVEHRGHVSVEELGQACRRAQAGVQASHFETCGFATMETLAQGAHAIVSDNPYLREIYGDQVFRCDPFSERSIADAMRQVLAQPAGDYQTFLSGYAWPAAIRKMKEAYEGVWR